MVLRNTYANSLPSPTYFLMVATLVLISRGKIKGFLFHSLLIVFCHFHPPSLPSSTVIRRFISSVIKKNLSSEKTIGGENWTSIYRILFGEVGKGISL